MALLSPRGVSANITVDTADLEALVGEITASPTANTVLDRLKTLATVLTARLGAVGEAAWGGSGDGSLIAISKAIHNAVTGDLTLDAAGLLFAPSSSVVAGTNAVTTAEVLAVSQACIEVLVQADDGNAEDVLLGDATTQPIRLAAGKGLSLPVTNVNLLYAKSADTGVSVTVNWLARG